MPQPKRIAADAAAEPANLPRLDQYRAERAAAQAQLVAASMDQRRFGTAPTDCESEYVVLDQ